MVVSRIDRLVQGLGVIQCIASKWLILWSWKTTKNIAGPTARRRSDFSNFFQMSLFSLRRQGVLFLLLLTTFMGFMVLVAKVLRLFAFALQEWVSCSENASAWSIKSESVSYQHATFLHIFTTGGGCYPFFEEKVPPLFLNLAKGKTLVIWLGSDKKLRNWLFSTFELGFKGRRKKRKYFMLRLTISVHPPLQSAFCENICGCFFILNYDSICSEMDFTLCHKTAR